MPAIKRKEIKKRLRFEIFKRDHFTCQYCGAQPPTVVLVVDHIKPVNEGGETVNENLITACENCNSGKSGIPLSHIPVRPDADLLYLETQQEIAELRRYQEAKENRDYLLTSIVETLQQTWVDHSGLNWHPSNHIFMIMLDKYAPELVEQAVIATAPKVAGGYITEEKGKWIGYMWGTLRKLDGDNKEPING